PRQAHQQDGDHQQRGGDRPLNEGRGDIGACMRRVGAGRALRGSKTHGPSPPPPPPRRPPPPPPKPRRICEKALEQSALSESRFWNRQKRLARAISVALAPAWGAVQSFLISSLHALLRAAAAWARRAARAASSAPEPDGAVILPVGLGISTSAPSRSRSAPSTTTVSPPLMPDRIWMLLPSCTPVLTVRWATVFSGVTTKT